MRIFVCILALLLLAPLGAQCVSGPLDYIELTPDRASVAAGMSLQIKAAGLDASDKPVTLKNVVWTVDPASAGTVKSGKFTAKGALVDCVVTASVGNISSDCDISIVPGAVKTLTINPTTAPMHPGDQQQFTVSAGDSFGNEIDTSAAVWTLKPKTGLTIDEDHLVTAGGITGTFTGAVTVKLGTKTVSATVTVTPVPPASIAIVSPDSATIGCGDKVSFTAEAYDAQDRKLDGQTFTWTCDAAVGKLSPTKGATVSFTAAKKPASGEIRVTCALPGSPVESMQLRIAPGAPKTVKVTAPKSSLSKDQTGTFTAVVSDQMGNVLDDAVVVWSLLDGDAGSIDADTGIFTAGSLPATYKNAVVATVQGTQISGAASVTVTPQSDFYFRTNQPGEYYSYDVSGSGSVSGTRFAISGSASITFSGQTSYDYFDNRVRTMGLNLDLTVSAQGESLSASMYLSHYYTQDEDGAYRSHGAYGTLELEGYDLMNGQSVWVESSPGYVTTLPSPISAGQKGNWTADFTTGDSSSGSYSVKSRETVTVPAGKYLCVSVAESQGLLGNNLTWTDWYSPEIAGIALIKGAANMSMSAEGESLSMKFTISLLPESDFASARTSSAPSREYSPLFLAVARAVAKMFK